jgi:hypothetical protein
MTRFESSAQQNGKSARAAEWPLPGPTVAAIVSMFAEIGDQARRVSEALAPIVEAEQERRRRKPPMWAIDPARSKRPRKSTRRIK